MDKYDQELAKFFGIDELIKKEIKTEPKITVKDFEVINGVRIIKKIELNSVSVNDEVLNIPRGCCKSLFCDVKLKEIDINE